MKNTAILSPPSPSKYVAGKTIRATVFPLITVALVIANLAVWTIMSRPSEQHADALVNSYAFVPVRLSANFANNDTAGVATEVLRSVSSLFVHEHDFSHVGLNMLFLFIFGISVERQLGRRRFTALYLLSGALTCAAYFAICPDGLASFGASSAICGVLGAYVLLFAKKRVFSSLILLAVMALNVYCAISVTQAGFTFFAHLIGFVIGLLSAGCLVPRRTHVYVPAQQRYID